MHSLGASSGTATESRPGSKFPLSIDGEYKLTGALHRTGGAGNKTLLRRGEFLTNEIKLKSDYLLPEDWHWLTNVHARRTNDPQIDRRNDIHLLGLTSEIYNQVFHLTVGDFYGDFSEYTMNQSLEGLQTEVKTKHWDSKALAGWSQHAEEGKQFTRYVFGGHSEYSPQDEEGWVQDKKLGLHFVEVEDYRQSIHDKKGVKPASNPVGSVTTHALLWGKTELDGELAESWFNEDTSPGSYVNRRDGMAVRLNSTTKFSKKAKAKLGYERVSSGFNSLSGSAVPDRVNWKSRFDYKWTKSLKSSLGYRVSYDKLNKSSLVKRTITEQPRISLEWIPQSDFWEFKEFYSMIYWEMRDRYSEDDRSGQTDFQSHEIGIENEFKFFKWKFSPGWNLRDELDHHDKSNNRLFNTGYVGIRTTKTIRGIKVSPSFRWQATYEHKRKLDGRDLTHTFTAGLNLELTKSLRFEQRYSLETASRLAHDADTTRFTAHAALDYDLPFKVHGLRGMSAKLSYDHTNFVHVVGTERFLENNGQAQLVKKF